MSQPNSGELYWYLGTMGANYYDYLVADQIMIPEKIKAITQKNSISKSFK